MQDTAQYAAVLFHSHPKHHKSMGRLNTTI